MNRCDRLTWKTSPAAMYSSTRRTVARYVSRSNELTQRAIHRSVRTDPASAIATAAIERLPPASAAPRGGHRPSPVRSQAQSSTPSRVRVDRDGRVVECQADIGQPRVARRPARQALDLRGQIVTEEADHPPLERGTDRDLGPARDLGQVEPPRRARRAPPERSPSPVSTAPASVCNDQREPVASQTRRG